MIKTGLRKLKVGCEELKLDCENWNWTVTFLGHRIEAKIFLGGGGVEGMFSSLVIGTLVLWDLSCRIVFGEVYK